MVPERKLREEMLKVGHLLYQRNLLVALDGNLSALLEDGSVLCTRAGCHKGFLVDEDLIVVDTPDALLILRRGASQAVREAATLAGG